MEIGAIFRKARKTLGITLVDLAKQVDTNNGNLSRFETGKQGMTTDTMTRVMQALNMSFAGPGIEGSVAYRYPLLEWAALGEFLESGKSEGHDMKAAEDAGEGAFWVEVITDQMVADHAPSFVEGTRILVDRRSTTLENGKLYLFYLPDPGEYVFRKYVGYEGDQYLRPLKSSYAPVPMPTNTIVVGRIVDSRQAL